LGLRFNPAPGWPPPPPGFMPPPHWQPDPSWPPAPPGWQIWVDDGIPDQHQPSDPRGRAGRGPAAANGGLAPGTGAFPADPTGVQARPGAFGSGAADAPWAGDFATGPGDAPPWASDLTGPQTAALRGPQTQAYTPGATGPQAPYDSDDLFSPRDPFTRQGPGPGGPPGGPGRRAGAPPGKANGFAVGSLILGLLGITVIGAIGGIVLGILALRQIGRTGQRGRGLAIAGIALSAFWLVLIGAYFVLHGGKSQTPPPAATGHSSSPTPGPSSTASHGTSSTNVFALKPGQCFQNPPASQTVLGVTYVTVVPCTTPHNAQAFVQFTATGTSYPGVDALKRQADTGCHARITKSVQKSKIKDSMSLHYLYPLESSWTSGHKTITCLIVNSKPNLKTSLMRTHRGH
jgi:uncharacterized protein DUF4190/putative regulator of septum formation